MLATVFQHSYVTTPTRTLVRRNASALNHFAEATESAARQWTRTTAAQQFQVDEAGMVDMHKLNIDSIPKPKLPFLPVREKTGHRKQAKKQSKPRVIHQKNGTVTFQTIKRGIPDKVSQVAREMLDAQKAILNAVLIITNYRSGSTFLGQLFNQHPDAFYTFEPLYPFGSNCSFELHRRVKTIHEMIKCSFPDMSQLYQDLHKDPNATRTHRSCLKNNFCFRYNHKELCTPDTCPNGNKETCMSCGPADLQAVKNKCRSRKTVVIKLIRLCYIEDYKALFEDPRLNLKVIHLVRDPRGIASSRLKIHPEWDIVDNIRSTCHRQVMNVKAGRNVEWITDKYKLVRYEDLALNPQELAKDIYDFVGIPFTQSVRDWISQNTQLKVKSKSNFRERLLANKPNGTYETLADPYATQRDSKIAMQAWRNHLSPGVTGTIQKHCYETLRSLGYYDFKTVSEQLNLNISSIL